MCRFLHLWEAVVKKGCHRLTNKFPWTSLLDVKIFQLPKYPLSFMSSKISFAITGSLLLLPLSFCSSSAPPRRTPPNWEGFDQLVTKTRLVFIGFDKAKQCSPDEKSEADNERQTVQCVADCHPPEQTWANVILPMQCLLWYISWVQTGTNYFLIP